MGRNKSPHPHILALAILMELYIKSKHIPQPPDYISEAKYLDEVRTALAEDGIIKSEGSKNIASKLLGSPAKSQEKEGIHVDMLEQISEVVFKYFHLDRLIDKKPIEYFWPAFRSLINTPSDLRHLDDLNYYKDIKDNETREKVDQYVSRKVSELSNQNTTIYQAHFYSDTERRVKSGVISIDIENRLAIMKLIDHADPLRKTKNVLRSDVQGGYCTLHDTVLHISLGEEDQNKKNFRMYLCLSILDSSINFLTFIRGVYITSAFNHLKPVAGLLLLEKMPSYFEAYTLIKTDKMSLQSDKILIDLLSGWRILIEPDRIMDTNQLPTARTARLVDLICGAYVFGYLLLPISGKKVVEIGIGLCFIKPNGLYEIYNHEKKEIVGNVNSQVFYSDDLIQLNNTYSDGLDSDKFTFMLKLIKNGDLFDLAGLYFGAHAFKPLSGEVYFVRVNSNSYSDLKNNYSPTVVNLANSENIENSEVNKIITYLKSEKEHAFQLTLNS